jgi:hypothetical protein
MAPELREILGDKIGTKFRFPKDSQTTYEILEIEAEAVEGKEEIVGYRLRENGPRMSHLLGRFYYQDKVYMSGGGNYQPEEVEIIKEGKEEKNKI